MKAYQARKRFGQHFLRDRNVIGKIIEAMALHASDHVVEIGPGQGALTRELARRLSHFEAVEFDRDLIAPLQTEIGADKLSLHQADALKFVFFRLATHDRKLRLVGNLPYNISTPLLFHLLTQARCIEDMLFMLQKEVVQRLAAVPGGKDYGRLSVMIQYRCRVEKLFNVAPEAFSPPPRVESSMVRLIPHSTPPVEVKDEATFAHVVRAAFASRRKTLRNNLKGLLDAAAMAAVDIDPTRRAETLSLAEFAALSNKTPPAPG